MQDKRKVLIVSFHFPPENEVSALRIGKFSKYLPEFGWEPLVLTAETIHVLPQTLPVETEETNIVRIPYFTLSQFVAKKLVRHNNADTTLPRSQIHPSSSGSRGTALKAVLLMKPIYSLPAISKLLHNPIYWYRSGVRKGLELARKGDIDIIFSSYGPSVCHLIASRLQRRTGIPWVAEFRDLWSLNPYSKKTEPFHFFERQWEKRTMKNAAFLVTVSKPMAQELAELHSRKSVTIPNGFDEADYTENIPLLPKLTITYTGNIYPGKRDPAPLFQAIAELRDEGKLPLDSFEVRFYGGNVLDTIRPLIEKYKIAQFVKIFGLVPFRESVRRQKESTALLLLSWNDPKDKGVYTGKIFEYLGASRPTLAIGRKGSVIDELLAETGSGIIATKVGEIKNILMTWLEEFSQYGEISSYYHPNVQTIKRYTRREQAEKLAGIFNDVINQDKSLLIK